MTHQVAQLFAEYGGFIGLIIFALFFVVVYLIRQQTRLTERLIKTVEANDERLIDFKRETYKNLPYRDRRSTPRIQVKTEDNDD